MCHITSKSYVNSEVGTVNVRIPSMLHRAHHFGHPRCPRAPSLYITVWRRMGALVVSVHKGRQAGAQCSNTQNMCHISTKSYMNSDVVTVNVRNVHWCMATHGRPGGASTQRPSGRSQMITNATYVPYHFQIQCEFRSRHCKRSNSIRLVLCPPLRPLTVP